MTVERSQAEDRKSFVRFMLISLARVGGVFIVLGGIVVTSGRFAALDPWTGYAIIAAGFAAMVVLPRYLARRWRTPDP